MSKFFQLTLAASCVFLTACFPLGNTPAADQQDASSSPSPTTGTQEATAPRETPNVTYKGIVQPAGISIYQQGSHRLVLDDNRFILLESDQVDLNGYVGETVEVFGTIRPTVEEGGIIMNVENIHLDTQTDETATGTIMEPEDTTSTPEEGEVASEPSTTAEEEPTVVPPAEGTTGTGVTAEPESNDSENGLMDNEVNQPTSVAPSADKLESIIAMSKDAYSPERWTQQYCTGHIGFCMPIHKNWWYKSFGNTTTNLWQVEMRNAPIEDIGDGVIVAKLVSGTVASAGATDGQVRVQGDLVTGYRSWEGGTHFEIVADARLTEPVTYITQHIAAYQE